MARHGDRLLLQQLGGAHTRAEQAAAGGGGSSQDVHCEQAACCPLKCTADLCGFPDTFRVFALLHWFHHRVCPKPLLRYNYMYIQREMHHQQGGGKPCIPPMSLF